MENTNVLAGVACPRCGNDERLRIAGTVWLDMTDDGTVPSDAPGRGDHEWDRDSVTECPKCDFIGRFSAFVGVPRNAIVRQSRETRRTDDLDGRVARLELAIENLRHHSTTKPAGNPEQVRDMICDALDDAHRWIDSETGKRRRSES